MIKENLVELFANSLQSNWDKPAFSDYLDKKTYTYGQVANQVARLHLLFKEMGIEKGDKIAVIGKNGSAWCTTYVATVCYGAVIVPILQDFPAANVHHIVTHSDSKLLFVSDYVWKNLNASEMPNLLASFSLNYEDFTCFNKKEDIDIDAIMGSVDTNFNALYPNGYTKSDIKFDYVTNSDVVCINYTSGTTGFSKGVMLTSGNFVGNVTFIKEIKLMENAEVVSFLPLAHVYCMTVDFLSSFCEGSHTHYLGKTPAAPILMKAFAEVKPDVVVSVPLIIEKIYKKKVLPKLNNPLIKCLLAIPGINRIIYNKFKKELENAFGGRFREVIIGGAAFNPEAEAFFRKINFRFTVGYGMTECAPLISKSPWNEFRLTSVGELLPRMEAKIDSEDPHSVVGELLVRGVNVMAGYYKNEEATNEVIDKDGWLHTGDLGIMDKDNHIYLRGRNKNMLLGPNGQNIYPEEIEAKLNNTDLIVESIVLQNKAHKLIALVNIDTEEAKKQNLSDEQIAQVMEHNRKAVNKQIGSYEQITEIRIHGVEFEKTAKKSIKRYLYKDMAN